MMGTTARMAVMAMLARKAMLARMAMLWVSGEGLCSFTGVLQRTKLQL